MGSRPRTHGRPTVYLDTSTLSDAFAAAAGGATASPVFAPLRPWIEHVAATSNLCVSLFHILELADLAGERAGFVDELAAWLDGLSTVWLASPDRIMEAETRNWLRVTLGVASEEGGLPYVPSMLTSFREFNFKQVVSALGEPTMQRLLREARAAGGTSARRSEFLGVLGNLRTNHELYEPATRAEQRKEIEENIRADLRRYALDAAEYLRGELDRHTLARVHSDPEILWTLFTTNPRALPSFRLSLAYNAGVLAQFKGRKPGGANERKMGSGFVDYIHATLGGAYCDVFTCDFAVDGYLGDARERLGLRRQLSVRRRGAEAFVRELMASGEENPSA